jgi:hypothetical protein
MPDMTGASPNSSTDPAAAAGWAGSGTFEGPMPQHCGQPMKLWRQRLWSQDDYSYESHDLRCAVCPAEANVTVKEYVPLPDPRDA